MRGFCGLPALSTMVSNAISLVPRFDSFMVLFSCSERSMALAATHQLSRGCTRFQNSSKAMASKKAVTLTILPSFISMNQA